MLGGDRAIPVNCPTCDEPMVRDLLGSYVCLTCVFRASRPHAVTRGRKPGDPEWFYAGTTTAAGHIMNVRRGLHPMGFKLGPDGLGRRCGNCRFLARNRAAKTYLKCSYGGGYTNGPLTDVRGYWPGCEKWAEPGSEGDDD